MNVLSDKFIIRIEIPNTCSERRVNTSENDHFHKVLFKAVFGSKSVHMTKEYELKIKIRKKL